MKHTLRNFFACCILLSSHALFSDAVITPYFSMRSQGQDTAREMVDWTKYVNLYDEEKVYGAFSITAEYAQSFNTHNIARSLFGDYACSSKCPAAVIPVSGSRVADRGANDWLADYFYLPTDYQSTLLFTPRIENVIFDVNFYLGLDKWIDGLFFKFQAPVVWSRWNLNFVETNINRGVNNHVPGYFNGFMFDAPAPDGVGIFRDNLLENFTRYAVGDTVIAASDTTFNALDSALIDPCKNAKTGLADIHLTLGYNFAQCEDYHVGLGLRVVAPTGSRPTGTLLFEPMIGNGKFWEIGGYFTAHSDLWTSECGDKSLGIYIDATLTHMVTGEQTRTFDLKAKPFSRYMLAERMGPAVDANDNPINTGLVGSPIPTGGVQTAPNVQFVNAFIPVANISTLDVRVGVAVQADITAQCTFGWNNFLWDIGYNFWARSCEKITSDCPSKKCSFPAFAVSENTAFAETTWALKGDAFVVGFVPNTAPPLPDIPVNLSATQGGDNLANITHGGNFFNVDLNDAAAVLAAERNPRIDNPQFAFANDNTGSQRRVSAHLPATATQPDQTQTSIQPIVLTADDLDIVGTRGLSNKIFTHLSYNWFEHPYWTPYLGAGAFVEFGSKNNDCAKTANNITRICESDCTTTCVKTAVSQWGLWIKGGVAF